MSVNKFGQHSIQVGLKRGPPGHGFNVDSDGNFDIKHKKLVNVSDATLSEDAINKRMLDKLKTELKSDFEKVEVFFDFENKRIIRLNEPKASFHAATKGYVDSKDKLVKEQIRVEFNKIKQEIIDRYDAEITKLKKDIEDSHKKISLVEHQLVDNRITYRNERHQTSSGKRTS